MRYRSEYEKYLGYNAETNAQIKEHAKFVTFLSTQHQYQGNFPILDEIESVYVLSPGRGRLASSPARCLSIKADD